MSATTSPFGNSSGRASVPGLTSRAGTSRPEGRTEVSGGYRDRPDGSAPGGPPPRGPGRGGGPGGPAGRPYKGKRKPRWGRIALVAGIAVVVLAVIGGISAYGYASHLDNNLKRTDAFSQITGGRPAKTVDGALNILIVGSDSRDPDASDDTANAWRADTLMLMHIPADHKSAQIVSIPRDLYVAIPTSNAAPCSTASNNKINASFAFGGLPRAVKTVECLTNVHIDHVAAIDFGGFKDVTDALGGVDLKVDQTITSIHKPHRVFTKGMMHMNGDQALDWVRQRKQFARGDFARMQHQQQFLVALMDKASSTGTLSNPAKLNSFLKAVTAAVTVDNDFSLTDMAVQFRNLRSNDITFLTSPNLGSETIAGQSVVTQDHAKEQALFQAIAADKMTGWMAANQVKPSASAGG
jgi:LCP family protein required for cell wall assembly